MHRAHQHDSESCSLGVIERRLEPLHANVHLNINADEHLPAGADYPWTTWKALNRLRAQVGRSRVSMSKWGYSNETETCDCGIRQTMQHLLVCPMMNTACSAQYLTTATMASPSAVPGIGRAQFDKCDWWKENNDDDESRIRLHWMNIIMFTSVNIYQVYLTMTA